MKIEDWIGQEKENNPYLSDFLTKITPYFGATGFNASEFERKVAIGVKKAETDIEETLKLESDVIS